MSTSPSTETMHTHQVRMRDGVHLATDVFLPASLPAPVLLVRTPYNRSRYLADDSPSAPTLRNALVDGFAVVVQDCRGTGAAEGVFEPLVSEEEDGVDTLDWLTGQEWSTGKVASFGDSYLGFTQFAMAVNAHPALVASIPVNTAGDTFAGWIYSPGGVLSAENTDRYGHLVAWVNTLRAGRDSDAQQILDTGKATSAALRDIPARAASLTNEAPWFAEFLRNPAFNSYWEDRSFAHRFPSVTAAALHIGGWFDFFSDSTATAYTALRNDAATPSARDGQHLVLGPWTHISTTGAYDAADFGPDASAASLELENLKRAFLARHVLGADSPEIPRVHYFAMGANEWRTADEWPLPGASAHRLHLDAGDADDRSGLLSAETANGAASVVVPVDPSNPVPTLGGRLLSVGDTWTDAGPADQRANEGRDDVLSFDTAPYDTATEVTGHLALTLYVTFDSPSADFAATVTDVAPNGTSRLLTEGITRIAASPSSSSSPEPVQIDLSVTSNVFLPGHRLRVNVAASNFPRYDVNPDVFGTAGATLAIHTGVGAPSHLVIPVVGNQPREGDASRW